MPRVQNPVAYHAAIARNKARAIATSAYHKGKSRAKSAVKREIQRGLTSASRAGEKYVRSGAFGRDMQRLGAAAVTRGMGDISVRPPEPYKRKDYGNMPKFSRHGGLEKGEMTICHSEYIGELLSGASNPSSFTSQNYGLNAGNPGTFPWFSTIASSFQNYRFKKLVFEFRPLCPDAATSTSGNLVSLGTVMLATQYDSVIGPYSNKSQMENSDFGISCKPSEHVYHVIECNPKYNPLGEYYVSSNTSYQTTSSTGTNTVDVRFQNIGIFQIASIGQPTTGSSSIDLGEIFCHYEVELLKPTILGQLAALQSSHYQITGVTANTAFLGTTQTAAANNQLPLTFPTANSFAFPLAITQGSYLMVYYLAVSNGGATTITLANGTTNEISVANGTAVQIFQNVAGGVYDATHTAAGSVCSSVDVSTVMWCAIISVNAPGNALCTVTMPSAGQTCNSPANAELFVTPWNINMVA